MTAKNNPRAKSLLQPKPVGPTEGVGHGVHRVDGRWGRAQTIFDSELYQELVGAEDQEGFTHKAGLVERAARNERVSPLTLEERREIAATLHEVEAKQHREFHVRSQAIQAATSDTKERSHLRKAMTGPQLERLVNEAGVTTAEWEALAMTAEGGSIREIAGLLGIAHQTVHRRLSRARRKIQAIGVPLVSMDSKRGSNQ